MPLENAGGSLFELMRVALFKGEVPRAVFLIGTKITRLVVSGSGTSLVSVVWESAVRCAEGDLIGSIFPIKSGR